MEIMVVGIKWLPFWGKTRKNKKKTCLVKEETYDVIQREGTGGVSR